MTIPVLKIFECFYCRQHFPADRATADHFVPRSRKGHARPDNLVAACRACNEAKAAVDPREYGLHRPAAETDLQRERLTVFRALVAERRREAGERRANRRSIELEFKVAQAEKERAKPSA